MKTFILGLLCLISTSAFATNSPIIYSKGCAYNILTQSCLGGAGASISDLNGLTLPTQVFATGSSGSDFSISSSSATHTFSIPTASNSARGLLSASDYGRLVPAAVLSFYVDGSRADSYTADGSFSKPYKTIEAGVARMAANAIPGIAQQLLVMGPWQYPENIILEDTNLTDVYITGIGGSQSIDIAPASGNALQSTASNDNLHILVIQNMMFEKPVVLTNPGGGSNHFLDARGYCGNCIVNDVTTLTNALDWELDGGQQASDITLDGSTMFVTDGLGLLGNLSITNGSIVVLTSVVATGDITNDATSTLQFRSGSRVGSSGGNLTNAGTMTGYNSFVRSNIANSGTFIVRGALYKDSTLTNTGTVTKDVGLGQFNSFTSGSVTCTGSAQNVAHGLGYTPTHVLVSAQDDTAAHLTGYVITEGTHDSTNVVLTCTANVKVKVMAF